MASRSSRPPDSFAGEGALAAVHSRLNALADRLDDLSRTKPHLGLGPEQNDLATAVRALETRLDAISAPAASASLGATTALSRAHRLAPGPDLSEVDAPEDRLAAVDQILARLNPSPPSPASPLRPARWSGSLDDAIAEIASRQIELDGPAQLPAAAPALPPAPAIAPEREALPDLSGLQAQLVKLTHELQTLRQPGGFAETVASMRGELASIRQAMTEAAPREAMQRLQADVETLTERLDDMRRGGESSERLGAIEQKLTTLRDILDALSPAESLAGFREDLRALDRKLDRVARERDDAGLEHLESQIADLREVAAHAATGEAMIALAEEVQRISERLEDSVQAHPQQWMSALDGRLRELSAELSRGVSAGDGASSRSSDEISAMVGALAEKLDRADLSASPVLETITGQLSRLAERIEASDARLGNLDVLERGLGALLDELENLRVGAIATAQRAAQEAVGDLARAGGVAPAEFDQIKQDIEGLRHLHAQSDRRTQDTLEAVHDTLARLVERVALFDSGAPASATTAPALLRPAAAPAIVPAATPQTDMPDDSEAAHSALDSPAIAGPERRAIDPTLPADHPLEPGSATRGRPSAAERIAASEAALGDAKPAAPPKGDARANFIAAARRAAQAAADVSAGAPDVRDEESKPRRSLGSAVQKLSRRRPLMLGLAILVLAGTLHLVLNVMGTSDPSIKPRGKTGELVREKPKANVAKAPAFTIVQPEKQASAAAPEAPATPSPAPADHAAAAPAPAAQTTAASTPDARAVPAVSPLTIAAIQFPGSDVTGSIGRPAASAKATGSDGGNAAGLSSGFSTELKSAAASGNAAASYEIGARYAEGRGTAPHLEEAVRWFERAASQGLAPAQYRLGSMYEKGQGVRKDPQQARRLYRAAADQGNGKAMHNLAVLHAEGIDGKPDFAAAAQWFRKAAERGVSDSQYNLGILYARGLGLDQNLAKSYKWFSLAAAQSDQDAARKRDDVSARLDATALAAAKAAVEAFRPEPQPESAITVAAPAGGWDAAAVTPPARPKAAGQPRRLLAH